MPARGEAPRRDAQEVETIVATAEPKSPASTEHLMEAICDPDNLEAALDAVVRNKGAPGIDGITVKQLPDILKARWPEIEDQLLQGRYQPQPVRRVRIPKPDGGTRNLGIPTVIDRVIQQAILLRLSRCGTQYSASTATASGRAAPLTKRWRRRKPTSSKAIGSSWILTWPNSSTGSITTG
jgi:retron-type reverse transcriptase